MMYLIQIEPLTVKYHRKRLYRQRYYYLNATFF